ncbi:unnamed protein product [Rotaria sordida]|uniref:F-box domain-containing protein n=1 Tax=Rotaria sordida TaxID=392033 RepID=A0A815QM76_9BILA|nr:unnamed protein product [Rotaria sordida]
MEDSSIELNELPDEILIIILKKLFNTEVLYSLIDVNKRLNTIVHDPIFTSHLTLMRCFSDDSIYPLPDSILDRFCSQILSSIHHKIKWLNLESSSMKRILRATNYPNLYGLGLYNIEAETALSLFIEDIQHTFRDFKDDQVISYVDYFQKEQCSLCHIYLYLDQLKYYYTVTNNFPGGLFPCVRKISLYDDHPFEHEFFLRIAQSFPFMQTLSLKNFKPQNNKLCKESQNDNQNFSIINYPYLTNLTLYDAHDDYIEEFLVDTKICLPNNAVHVNIYYEQLKRVTHNFTRDTTRINCAKLNSLHLNGRRLPKYAKDYFPHV